MMKKLILSVLFVCSLSLAQMPNYFYTTLTGTITSTDTTCQIASSDTTYFGSRTNFYATIWDTYYSSPSHARSRGGKYETVLIESRSGLTLQIVRARLGSTAQNFNTAGRTYRITAEVLNNIYDSLSNSTDSIYVHRIAINKNIDSISSHRVELNKHTDSLKAIKQVVSFNNVTSIAASKTYYLSRLSSTGLDSSTATAQQIAGNAFITSAGNIKNLRVFNAGNAFITTYIVTLVKVSAFSANVPSAYQETSFTLNAPASPTGIYTATTTESVQVGDGEIYVFKVRTGSNGGFSPASTFISYDFYPLVY